MTPDREARPRLVIDTHNGRLSQSFGTDDELLAYLTMFVAYIPPGSTWWVER